MMKATTTVLGLLCAAVCQYAQAASVTTIYPHVPLVFWSARPMFQAKDAYLNAVFDENDVVFTLNNVLARDTSKDHYNVLSQNEVSFTRPEALCVFLRKNLRSEQLGEFGKQSFVQSAVKESTSSVVIPHTTRTYSLTSALSDVKPAVVSVEDVDAWIKSTEGKKLMNNDETDLLIVEVPEHYSFAEADALMKKASASLLQASENLIDFALTGDEGAPVVVKNAGQRRLAANKKDIAPEDLICEAGYLIGTAGGKAFCFSHFVHMTPEVLTGLIFGLFFVFLSYVGLSVLNAIQTPTRYPHHGPPKGKEF